MRGAHARIGGIGVDGSADFTEGAGGTEIDRQGIGRVGTDLDIQCIVVLLPPMVSVSSISADANL